MKKYKQVLDVTVYTCGALVISTVLLMCGWVVRHRNEFLNLSMSHCANVLSLEGDLIKSFEAVKADREKLNKDLDAIDEMAADKAAEILMADRSLNTWNKKTKK